MFTKRSVAAAGTFLDGAASLLILCALAAPFVFALTFSFGNYLLAPLSCVVPIMLGVRAAKSLTPGPNSLVATSLRQKRGYWVGLFYAAAYIALLAIVTSSYTRQNDITIFAVEISLATELPAFVVCLGFFWGELVTDGLEIVAGCFPAANENENPNRSSDSPAESRGFLNGGATLVPAFVATLLEFLLGSAWHHSGDYPGTAAPSSVLTIYVEVARLVTFVMAFCLHEAFLILVISRIRAVRLGSVAFAHPSYLRLLCFLAICVIGVLLATLYTLSSAPQ